jgi:hypothetical protein
LKEKQPYCLTRNAPLWLRWDEDRWQVIPEAKTAIVHLYKRSLKGIGQRQSVKEMNDQFKPLGESTTWSHSYIQKCLANRAVLGELTLKDGTIIKNVRRQLLLPATDD